MLDVCVLITAIETLFPQETVFNRFGVAITYLQWKVPKTRLCFDVIRRNGKWGCVTQFMGDTFGYGHPLTRSDCVHGPMKFLSDSQGEKSHGKNMHGKPIPSGLRVLIKFLILVLVINFKYYD